MPSPNSLEKLSKGQVLVIYESMEEIEQVFERCIEEMLKNWSNQHPEGPQWEAITEFL